MKSCQKRHITGRQIFWLFEVFFFVESDSSIFLPGWGIFIGTLPKPGLLQELKFEISVFLETCLLPSPSPRFMLCVFLCLAVLRLHSLALEMFMYSLPGGHTWSKGVRDKSLVWNVASHSPLQPPSSTQGKWDHCGNNLIPNQGSRNQLLLSSLWTAISCNAFPHIQASLLDDTR